MSSFHKRKAERKEHFDTYVKGWKLIPCGACNGSGCYDVGGSPKCGCCDGKGKIRVSPEKYQEYLKWNRGYRKGFTV